MGKKCPSLPLLTCFGLKSIMSYVGIAMTAYFFLTFVWNFFLYLFYTKVTVNLVCFLEEQKDGSHLLTQPVIVWLFIMKSRLLIFRVITERCILLPVICLILWCFLRVIQIPALAILFVFLDLLGIFIFHSTLKQSF